MRDASGRGGAMSSGGAGSGDGGGAGSGVGGAPLKEVCAYVCFRVLGGSVALSTPGVFLPRSVQRTNAGSTFNSSLARRMPSPLSLYSSPFVCFAVTFAKYGSISLSLCLFVPLVSPDFSLSLTLAIL